MITYYVNSIQTLLLLIIISSFFTFYIFSIRSFYIRKRYFKSGGLENLFVAIACLFFILQFFVTCIAHCQGTEHYNQYYAEFFKELNSLTLSVMSFSVLICYLLYPGKLYYQQYIPDIKFVATLILYLFTSIILTANETSSLYFFIFSTILALVEFFYTKVWFLKWLMKIKYYKVEQT